MFYKLYKQKNISSFNAIKQFAKKNNIAKIGHCGTLDPLAKGLLIVATNEHTKLIDYIYADRKSYIVEAKLHYSSQSYDEGSDVIKLNDTNNVTKDEILSAISKIKMHETQIPPIYSAKKINGIRSYKLARKNLDVALNAIKIKIFDLKLIDFNFNEQTFKLSLEVSKGTYVRTIIHDLAKLCQTDAIVTDLYRFKIGNIEINEQEEFCEINDYSKLFNVSLYTLSKKELYVLYNKKLVNLNNEIADSKHYLFTYKNEIIAFGQKNNGELKLTKIFYAILQNIITKETENDKI